MGKIDLVEVSRCPRQNNYEFFMRRVQGIKIKATQRQYTEFQAAG
jgi:hypothetical protein